MRHVERTGGANLYYRSYHILSSSVAVAEINPRSSPTLEIGKHSTLFKSTAPSMSAVRDPVFRRSGLNISGLLVKKARLHVPGTDYHGLRSLILLNVPSAFYTIIAHRSSLTSTFTLCYIHTYCVMCQLCTLCHVLHAYPDLHVSSQHITERQSPSQRLRQSGGLSASQNHSSSFVFDDLSLGPCCQMIWGLSCDRTP